MRFEFRALPAASDSQVSATISQALEYLRADASNPLVLEQCRRALSLGQGEPIAGVWRLLKSTMRFRYDDEIARDLQTSDPRRDQVLEVLIRPADQAYLIRKRGYGIEDCDGFEMFGGCLLHALGVPVALVTISADEDEPGRYSHVYLAAYPVAGPYAGQRVPLDFSHGPVPGWEPPHLGRMREWPVNVGPFQKFLDALKPVAIVGLLYLVVRMIGAAARSRQFAWSTI